MDKFDLSRSAKGLLQYSLDSFTKGKHGACVYQSKDCNVNDAREFIAALAFIDIFKSPISYMDRMINQVFGPIAKSTTNTGRFPKAVGADIIGVMSDISGCFYVMLNKSQGMVVLTLPPSELLHAKNSPSRLHAFEAQAVQWVEETRNSRTRMRRDIGKSQFSRDSSTPGLHHVGNSGRIYRQHDVFIQCTTQGFISEVTQGGKCAAVGCCPLDHDTA
jgi:hypothetical protein